MEKNSTEKPSNKDEKSKTPPHSDSGVENGLTPSKQYTQAVQQWLWQYHMHRATQQWMASTWQFYSTYVALNPPPVPGATPGMSTFGAQFPGPGPIGVQHGLRQPGGQHQQQQVPVAASLEFTMPSLYRRMIAELIDFILLFLMKLGVTLFIIEYLGIGDPSSFIMKFLIEEIDEDSSLEDLQQMLMFALVYRMFVCVYETFFLRHSVGYTVGGATPGKYFMGLRVVACERVQSLGGNKVLVTPAENLTYFQAFLRAIIKNFSMAFFFPACITVFFNPHFRAAYDILTHTMVVSESNWHDVFQRMPHNRGRAR